MDIKRSGKIWTSMRRKKQKLQNDLKRTEKKRYLIIVFVEGNLVLIMAHRVTNIRQEMCARNYLI